MKHKNDEEKQLKKEEHDEEMDKSESSDKTSGQIAQLEDELKRVKSLAEENYGLYLRSLADAENGKKRLLREVEASKRFALESLLKEILTVLDGFDKALSSEKAESNPFYEGVAIVRKQLFEVLEKNGLQEISAQGKKFDPSLHQAIKRTESAEVKEEIVEHEYAKGYKIFDKLLRPSIVSVLVPPTE